VARDAPGQLVSGRAPLEQVLTPAREGDRVTRGLSCPLRGLAVEQREQLEQRSLDVLELRGSTAFRLRAPDRIECAGEERVEGMEGHAASFGRATASASRIRTHRMP
jgi:hypothetical protein